jgi:molybdate transport system permease protein
LDWSAARLSIELASLTTLVLFVLGLPLAAWLARSRWRGRYLIEAALALPLVLPPTVLGFYLLQFASPASGMGRLYQRLTGGTLTFSFTGVLLASVLCNIPFAVRPFSAALAAVDRSLVDAAWCLGASRWRTFWRIAVPLAWPGIVTGMVLTFAHTIGEFGVVLMVGGNIRGISRTLAISIYDDVQALDYERANATALGLLLFTFVVLGLTSALNQGKVRVQ